MSSKQTSLLGAIAVCGLLLSACSKQEPAAAVAVPAPTNWLAIVGDQVITREAFENELASRGQVTRSRYTGPEEKLVLLEEMILRETLHQKALAAGYGTNPEIMARFKRMLVAQYQEDQLGKLEPPRVSEEDIADYYRRHRERFGTPEKIRFALIEMSVPRTATAERRAETERKAEAILAEAKAAANTDGTFGLLAQKHSEDQASRYRGGDIGWLTVGDTNAPWDSAVLTALAELTEPGNLAPVIETPEGFSLVKLMERQPASLRPIAEVRDGIEYWVTREKQERQQQALYTELKQGLNIRTNLALIESIMTPSEPPPPPPSLPALPTAQVHGAAVTKPDLTQ